MFAAKAKADQKSEKLLVQKKTLNRNDSAHSVMTRDISCNQMRQTTFLCVYRLDLLCIYFLINDLLLQFLPFAFVTQLVL